jgi:hypothetical protein
MHAARTDRANLLKTWLGAGAILAAFLVALATLVATEKPAEAAYPGQNGKLAFVRNGQIWTMNADGSNETPITTTGGLNPAWSPDGTRIAFQSYRDGSGDIYTMNANGSGVARLTDSPYADEYPTWSPDGTKIAFVHGRTWTERRLRIMDADGSDVSRVTFTSDDPEVKDDLENWVWWYAYDLAWSPDGTKIAFSIRYMCEGCEVFSSLPPTVATANVDGSNLAFVQGNDQPSWSPDGTRLAVTTSHADGTVVAVMDADGSNYRWLPYLNSDCHSLRSPAWAPDGKSLAVVGSPCSLWGVHLYAPDGSYLALLAPGFYDDIDWQPLPPSYTFGGFFSPVNNPPTLNIVKAGRAVPVKFSLGGDEGLDIFAEDYPKSRLIDCSSSAPLDAIEQTTSAAGGSSLSYEPTTERYTYAWKTKKAWAGTCRQLVVKLDDGSTHRGNFKFK